MWHTPEGERVVEGAEAALLKAATTAVAERIREESAGLLPQWEYGIGLFDSLSWTQRVAVLDRVATFLFWETPESIELSAVNEAAVGALFEHMKLEIDGEIDESVQCSVHWRRVVLAAYREIESEEVPSRDNGGEFIPLPDAHCNDHEQWHELIESLADRILWDRDYEMEEDFPDAEPARMDFVRDFAGIDVDYFSAVAPDVTSDEEADRLFDKLRSLYDTD